jgi:hypothetical protein
VRWNLKEARSMKPPEAAERDRGELPEQVLGTSLPHKVKSHAARTLIL